MDFEAAVDAELEERKKMMVKKSHNIEFKYKIKERKRLQKLQRRVPVPNDVETIVDAYEESLQIWTKIELKTKEGVWAEAFGMMHLFIRIVLDQKLHRRSPDSRFTKVSQRTLERLTSVESRLQDCLAGVRVQIEMKHRQAAAKKLEELQFDSLKVPPIANNTITPGKPSVNLDKPPPSYPVSATVADPSNLNGPVIGAVATPAVVVSPPSDFSSLPPPNMVSDLPKLPQLDLVNSYPSMDDSQDVTKINPTVVAPPPVAPASPVVPKIKPAAVKAADPFEKVHFSKFRIKTVPGDGHCAFRTIAQGMAGGTLSLDAESKKAIELRKLACKLLISQKSKDLKNIGLTVEQLVTMDPSGKHDSFSDYCRGMSKTDFAGEVELNLLAGSLKQDIYVYKKEGDSFRRLASYTGGGGRKPVFMLWEQGKISEAGNHYNVLLQN